VEELRPRPLQVEERSSLGDREESECGVRDARLMLALGGRESAARTVRVIRG
jgi:hypothetical protein